MHTISSQTEEDGFNNMYVMANSGARGSANQIKQLCGMKGLMTKPSGEIIEIPIQSNFKEGLSVLEYFISTSGARKGLADTALKTANSGYLTRKLVDVAQDCIVTEYDCKTSQGILAKTIIENGEIAVSLKEKILGRVITEQIINPVTNTVIFDKNKLIEEKDIDIIEEAGIDSVMIRSVLTCGTKKGVCAQCYGLDLATSELINIGEAVGIIAAQSIGEPGTQLTMRTFHIGGAAQKSNIQSNAISSHVGHVKYVHKNIIQDSKNRTIVMSRNCEAIIYDVNGHKKSSYKIPYGAQLLLDDNELVDVGTKLAVWDPFTIPIITEKSGVAHFVDLIDRFSVNEIQDEITGISNKIVTDSKQHSKGSVDLQPRIVLRNEDGSILTLANGLEARYFLPSGAILNIHDKQVVHVGDILARIPKESSKNKDITGGLPRVVELFEARQPRDHSIISESDGYIEFGKDYKSKRRILVKNNTTTHEYLIPRGRHITVTEGEYVKKGDMLMEGNSSPHDILRIMGIEALADYMVREIQQVYKLQGETINDKHIEIIIKQMLRKVQIVYPGGTTFLTDEIVDLEEFNHVNEKTAKLGYEKAIAIPILQGITKSSLQTQSFLSAASFQETTKILIEAAIAGKEDELRGLKENVIVGRLIPAGTGYCKRKIKQEAAIQEDVSTTAE
jgi:DNA-directed RNA polymerase subunit beta'